MVAASVAVGVSFGMYAEYLTAMDPLAHRHHWVQGPDPGFLATPLSMGGRPSAALLAVINQAQFVALVGEMSGKYMHRGYNETAYAYLFEPVISRDLAVLMGLIRPNRTSTLPARPDPTFVPMPPGVYAVAQSLSWTNIQTNLSVLSGQSELLPRTCDRFSMDVVVGTLVSCAVLMAISVLLRFLIMKLVKWYSRRSLGLTARTRNMDFPRWENTMLNVIFIGICQATGAALGSGEVCAGWMYGGIAILVLLPLVILVIECAWAYVSLKTDENIRWERREAEGPSTRHMSARLWGKWQPPHGHKGEEGYVSVIAVVFDQYRSRTAWFFAYILARKLVTGVVSAATDNSKFSGSLFLIMYLVEWVIIVVMQPWRDKWMNIVEAVLGMLRLIVVVIGLAYIAGGLTVFKATDVMVWLNLVGICLAVLNHVGEMILHFLVLRTNAWRKRSGLLGGEMDFKDIVLMRTKSHEGDGPPTEGPVSVQEAKEVSTFVRMCLTWCGSTSAPRIYDQVMPAAIRASMKRISATDVWFHVRKVTHFMHILQSDIIKTLSPSSDLCFAEPGSYQRQSKGIGRALLPAPVTPPLSISTPMLRVMIDGCIHLDRNFLLSPVATCVAKIGHKPQPHFKNFGGKEVCFAVSLSVSVRFELCGVRVRIWRCVCSHA
jgi:hypothetical protein